MQKIYKLLVFGLFFSFLASCIKEPDFPNEPEIAFVSLSKTNTTVALDSVKVIFSFTDGDGNLGSSSSSNPGCGSNVCDYTSDSSCYKNPYFDCFIIDARDSCYQFVSLPDVEPTGDIKSVSGEFEVTFFAFCKCGGTPCPVNQKNSYSIIIRDRAGNYSNIIQTDSITISCF